VNNKHFDSVFSSDYYSDKKVFFETGRKLFFSVFHILKNGNFELRIESNSPRQHIIIHDENEFKQWVEQNYPLYAEHLEEY
jgi:hypothetical protein